MTSKRTRFAPFAAFTTIFSFFYLNRYQNFAAQTASSWPLENPSSIDWSRFAYTQYVTNSEYLCNSLMFFEALQRLGSRPDRVMMVPESMLEPETEDSSDAYLINKARDEYNVKIVPITVQTHWAGDVTWADSYTKLLAFNQTQYDRVLSIDSDSVLLQAMDELFFLPSAPVAMPRAYWLSPEKVLSSQIMVVQPSVQEFSRIMERVQSVKSGEYDMEIVNQLYGDSALIFPHRRYDLLSGEFRNDNHAHYLGSEIETWDPATAYSEAKLIHFSDWPLPKPWKPISEEERTKAQPNSPNHFLFITRQTVKLGFSMSTIYYTTMGFFQNVFQRVKDSANAFLHPSPEAPEMEWLIAYNSEDYEDFIKVHKPLPPIPASPSRKSANFKSEPAVTETSYWPMVRKHILEDDPDSMPMKAICAICWDELFVTSLSGKNDKTDAGLVAPCGHIMCPTCWPRQVYDFWAVGEVSERKCPVCALRLECAVCKETCNKEMIPTYGGKASIEAFPKTILECDRDYRPCCKRCSGIIPKADDGFWFEHLEERDAKNGARK
ncbi:GNT1 alphan-acetylglucosamine transferase [Fusarium beomiforme]|uniref:GNT1 alphan-acetylglucosamine transferase n=1 Tax=Fusarium beomiforme TaxID=44412 RepID=A0A9P5AKJ3_9HYPO|nr:GNT1 alphan-acetylglucosamine transferase [Fusarium beomiforme]